MHSVEAQATTLPNLQLFFYALCGLGALSLFEEFVWSKSYKARRNYFSGLFFWLSSVCQSGYLAPELDPNIYQLK